MSFKANLASAITYYSIGKSDLADESLDRAYEQVDPESKAICDTDYLKLVTLLARRELLAQNLDQAAVLLDEGLAAKNDHLDLMFLKALYLLDTGQYPQIFPVIMSLLLVFDAPNESGYPLEFQNEPTLNEIYSKLLPISYKSIEHRAEAKQAIENLLKTRKSVFLDKAVLVMNELDGILGEEHNGESH